MADQNITFIHTENFFRLPFKPGTRVLTMNILNAYSDFRRPNRACLSIETRKLSFVSEVLTMGIVLGGEEEEKVYIKVTASKLLVSCSVDTEASYLSRYAYFTLYCFMLYYDQYDFEDYYWPGFFDPNTGECKYLMIYKSKNSLVVASKVRYKGLYKPGIQLPVLSKSIPLERGIISIVQEKPPKESHIAIGFCLADANNEKHRTNHYPFLVPYTGILNKDKTAVKGFKSYILSEKYLPEIDLTDEQQRLVEICFAMKRVALHQNPEYKEEVQAIAKRQKKNKENFNKLFGLWQQALPLLAGRLYTNYRYTFGMRNVKGKPSKSDMVACSFSIEVPKICFIWKDKGEYCKLELRIMQGRKIHEVSYFNHTAFFVSVSDNPRHYFLLNSLMDNVLVNFFQKNQFQLLILKVHYEGYCEDFVNQFKTAYQFIKR